MVRNRISEILAKALRILTWENALTKINKKSTPHFKQIRDSLNSTDPSYVISRAIFSWNIYPPPSPVLRIRIRWIRKILAFWIWNPADPEPREKILTKKLQKNFLLSNPKSELLKKKYENFLISEWFINF